MRVVTVLSFVAAALSMLIVTEARADDSPPLEQPTCTPNADFYPGDAKKRHEEGTVRVAYCVTEDATVTTRVVESSGHEALDHAAMCSIVDGIRRHAKPGVPHQPVCRTISVKFELKRKA